MVFFRRCHLFFFYTLDFFLYIYIRKNEIQKYVAFSIIIEKIAKKYMKNCHLLDDKIYTLNELYYSDGSLMSKKIYYKSSSRIKYEYYNTDGTLAWSHNYLDNIKHGLWLSFHINKPYNIFYFIRKNFKKLLRLNKKHQATSKSYYLRVK